MMRVLMNLGLVSGLALGCSLLAFAQQPILQQAEGEKSAVLNAKSGDEISVLMAAKLSSSQKVVEGLMSADFTLIRKGGEDLQKICDSTQWRSSDSQVFGHYRAELRRASIKLIDQAKEENLDGAAYAYMSTMSTCINCHQYSRDVLRIAGTHGDQGVVPIPVTESEARQFRSVYR